MINLLEYWDVILLTIVLAFILRNLFKRGPKNFPPGPYGLPFIGYLPFMRNERFRVLGELQKKYGSVFSMRIGKTELVILADAIAMNEAYSKTCTLDRPQTIFKFLPGGIGFISSNGKEWVEQRRHSVRAMRNLGLGKGPWEAAIVEEVNQFTQLLHSFNGRPVNISLPMTSSVTTNVISQLLGKHVEKGSAADKFLNHCVDVVARYFARIPLAINFPRLFNLLLKMKVGNLHKDYDDMIAFDEFFRREIASHDTPAADQECDNFIDEYLREMEVQKQSDTSYNVTNLRGNLKSLFIGGSETTRTSLDWLLLAMAAHPETQAKVHDELKNYLGDRDIALWEDRLKLPYTYAAIMEGQRWRTVLPLAVARRTNEDTQICGYDIPKGTSLMCNIWGLHNDERYWTEPEKFVPERFLKIDGTVNLKPESYAPFSIGKRNCPGETMALMEILLYFSAIVKKFEILPEDPSNAPSTDGFHGIAYQANPHKLRFKPRSAQ